MASKERLYIIKAQLIIIAQFIVFHY